MIGIVLILLIFAQCYVLYTVGIFVIDEWNMRKDAPYVGSYTSHKKLLIQNHTKIHGKTLLDMGCGDGGILRFFMKRLGYVSGDGYDIRRFPIWFGELQNSIYRFKNITLYQKDFQKAHLKKYDTIYLFLWSDIVVKLEKRIWDNIRPDTIVITNTFHFKDWKPYDTIKNSKGKVVFQLYRKN